MDVRTYVHCMLHFRVFLFSPMYICTYIRTYVHRLTVTQVNEFLDELAMSHVSKDRPGMKRVLQMLLRNTSALEQKWLVRIILKVRSLCVCTYMELFVHCDLIYIQVENEH